MITNIGGSGQYIQVTGGNPMLPYISPGAVGAGMLRWNTSSNKMEVWDGVTWKDLGAQHTNVSLTGEAESLLDWARIKRAEDIKFKTLLESHPGVRDLKEKLDIMIALVTQEEKDGTK